MITDFLRLVDFAAEIIPQNRSIKGQPKIIGHRGAYGPGREENSLASLMACAESGVWGVELDVRWTKDNVPVILHDETPLRCYQNNMGSISQIEFSRIRGQLKMLPTLADVVNALAGKCHLMIEVKDQVTDARMEGLQQALGRLQPVQDFHLLTLNTNHLENVHQIPRQAFILASEFHPRQASDYVLKNNWGGIAGHYLLLNKAIRKKHHDVGQKVGVGFVNGINNLYRQVRKNADWIFSDRALDLNGQAKALDDKD